MTTRTREDVADLLASVCPWDHQPGCQPCAESMARYDTTDTDWAARYADIVLWCDNYPAWYAKTRQEAAQRAGQRVPR